MGSVVDDSSMPGFAPQAERPLVVFHQLAPTRPDIVALFNPSTPDRTEALKGLAPSPLPFLVDSFRLLALFGVQRVGIACNTMHYWYDRALSTPGAPDCLRIPVAHMIHLTARALHRLGIRRAGLLATTGTVTTGIYQEACREQGVELVCPSHQVPPARSELLDEKGRARGAAYRQRGARSDGTIDAREFAELAGFLEDLLGEQEGLVMESIYGTFGIKAGFTTGVAAALMRRAAERLAQGGSEALVLGCTEVPLVLPGDSGTFAGAEVPLVDTTEVVARALVEGDPGRVGIAGGMGPAATIDMLGKMGLDAAGMGFLASFHSETIASLRRAGGRNIGDADHPKFLFIRTSRPEAFAPYLGSAAVHAVAFTDLGRTAPAELRGLPLLTSVRAAVAAGLAAKRAARRAGASGDGPGGYQGRS